MDTISEPAKPLPELVQQSELDTEIYFEGRTAFTKHLKGNNTWQLWKREQKIGEGSFSKVLLETCVETEEGKTAEPRPLRAVKVMKLKLDPKNPQQPNDLVISTYARELEILTKFSDPLYTELFVESYGWFRGENQICVALEYLPLGDLWRYFFESSPGKPPKRKKLPKDEVRNIMSQLLRALQTMHGNGFTHRDIKPENILVRRHPDWWVVLSDFGLSKRVESIRTGSSGMLGTMPFIAPEVYGSTEGMDWMPTDIYSLSELAVQMMTGRRTFDHPKAQSEYAAGKEDLFPSQRLYEHGADRTAVDFIQRLMAPIPHERLTAQAALEHAWITQN
ncbi:Protein kinase-like domain containing protein, partial [Naviculisporaceae sp. PSN 640]